MEHLLNFVYFFIGLAVGVVGLWQNQQYYIAQQQDKFDEINEKLQTLTESLAIIRESVSDKSHERESRTYSTIDSILRTTLKAEMLGRYYSQVPPEVRDSSEIKKELIEQVELFDQASKRDS